MTRDTHAEQAPRLLLVEDDADLQRSLLRQLRRNGFAVTAGSTLREGVELLRTQCFDAVLTDLALPDGEGTELARLLRDAPASPGVLVMTGHFDEAVSRQARVCGASDCIPKPVSVPELVARLIDLCARFPASVGEPRRILRPRALVLDDDRDVLRIVSVVLEDAGFAVSPAAYPAEALRLMEQERFDVAVCDLSMPGTNGLSFLETLRQRGELVPVIFLTGLPDTRSAIRAIELGAFRYLTKPFDHDELVAVARQAIAVASPTASPASPAAAASYDAVRSSATVRQLDLAQAHFDSALEGLWFAAYPILTVCAPRTLFGYELSLQSEDRRLCSPRQLFAAADRLGATARLRERVHTLAAEAAAAHPDAAVLLPVHPLELAMDSPFGPLTPLADRAERVVLVLSERVGLDSLPGLHERLTTLRARGFRLAVGDLGAGYASLTSLASMNPDIAKIDESLVRDVDTSPMKRSLVASITLACHDSGVLVIAEGVATDAELNTIVELGCDLAQGDLLGLPGRVPVGDT